ncbi:MAG: metallophosphoesterase family protein [Burkholderiales bacterium]|nr:metallophosphoesterase family protein [Burkholderiales bacterium]
MKLALLSDLHSNRQATEAVWAHAQTQGIDQLVLLGDFVDYGADPVWVVDFVRDQISRGAIAVRGNHDDAIDGHGTAELGHHVLQSLEWTRQQLSPDQQVFLASLPLTATVGPCLIAHANAHDPVHWGYVLSRLDAARSLMATPSRFVFCGHVHEPCLYHLSQTSKAGEFTPVPGVPIELSPARRWLAIPGSVGQPRDGNPAACYATFDTDSSTLTFHRVPYDHDEAARRILAAGLPAYDAERLIHGH